MAQACNRNIALSLKQQQNAYKREPETMYVFEMLSINIFCLGAISLVTEKASFLKYPKRNIFFRHLSAVTKKESRQKKGLHTQSLAIISTIT
jgi:hypothetical protein